jgi:hypothetical protein
MSARLRPDEYFVVTSSRGRPSVWTWEIQSRPNPLGIKLGGADFNSEPGAKLAGEKALIEFLVRLATRKKCPLMTPALRRTDGRLGELLAKVRGRQHANGFHGARSCASPDESIPGEPVQIQLQTVLQTNSFARSRHLAPPGQTVGYCGDQ